MDIKTIPSEICTPCNLHTTKRTNIQTASATAHLLRASCHTRHVTHVTSHNCMFTMPPSHHPHLTPSRANSLTCNNHSYHPCPPSSACSTHPSHPCHPHTPHQRHPHIPTHITPSPSPSPITHPNIHINCLPVHRHSECLPIVNSCGQGGGRGRGRGNRA